VWLTDQSRIMPADEQLTVAACLRQVDFMDSEIGLLDHEIARRSWRARTSGG
jgi:hypothetical protein